MVKRSFGSLDLALGPCHHLTVHRHWKGLRKNWTLFSISERFNQKQICLFIEIILFKFEIIVFTNGKLFCVYWKSITQIWDFSFHKWQALFVQVGFVCFRGSEAMLEVLKVILCLFRWSFFIYVTCMLTLEFWCLQVVGGGVLILRTLPDR